MLKQKNVKPSFKTIKINTALAVFLIAVLLAIGFFSGYFYYKYFIEKDRPSTVFTAGDFNIHFLELGNKYVGDCVYIQYGDIDILIDAGSRNNSANVITNYINEYITDKLDFVIATHGHQDHIAGFYSTGTGDKKTTGIFEAYEIDIIIDFPLTNSNTATYNNYILARDFAVSNGATHYTALECYNNESGAKREYELGEDVSLEILYNYYYENTTSNENNYSVCLMFHYGENQFLFTGDLETDGEEKLVDYYRTNFNGLGKCKVYKAGHHGSSSSSSNKLLNEITPEYVFITTCAGTSEYTTNNNKQFPTQEFINRLSLHTDKVYVTTLIINYSENQFTSFNGNIVFVITGSECVVNCSNNNIKLKDTEWFKTNRQTPSSWN